MINSFSEVMVDVFVHPVKRTRKSLCPLRSVTSSHPGLPAVLKVKAMMRES